jgi:hypothetical protein
MEQKNNLKLETILFFVKFYGLEELYLRSF